MLGALPTAKERSKLKLFDEYFGGSMSSILFQNVREFRSLAYSTDGIAVTTSLAQHAQEPQVYLTATGTQADKTMETLHIVDSLLHQMPMKEEILKAARQTVLSTIQNDYPTFREMTAYVANQRANGYTTDPNADIAQLLPDIGAQDVAAFHREHIGSNRNRVWVIVGDKKLTDLKALAGYGRVIELKQEDIYR